MALTFQGTFPAHVLQDLKDTFVKMTQMSVPHNLVSMVVHVRTNRTASHVTVLLVLSAISVKPTSSSVCRTRAKMAVRV